MFSKVGFQHESVKRAVTQQLVLFVLVACSVVAVPVRPSHGAVVVDLSKVLGTWAGESICVGNRPACKYEHVVYRFVAIDGRPHSVTLLGDKILDGKRVPMGKLEFEYTEADGSLRGEFTRGQTHGVWEYKVSGDEMTGTLVILPEKTLGRRVSVHRVREDEVPKTPPLEDY